MRKRIIIAAIVLAMGSAMAGLPAAAAKSQTYGDLTYINYGGWVEILDCAQDVVTVEIPEKIDGVKVRDIGDNAFSNCKSLTAITIPDGLEHIGEYAFSSCTSLTSITLPDSVKTIGGGAFGYCSALEELELPAKLETLGKKRMLSMYRVDRNDHTAVRHLHWRPGILGVWKSHGDHRGGRQYRLFFRKRHSV